MSRITKLCSMYKIYMFANKASYGELAPGGESLTGIVWWFPKYIPKFFLPPKLKSIFYLMKNLSNIYFFLDTLYICFSQNWSQTHDLLNKTDPMQIGMSLFPPEQVECTLF